MSGVRIAVVGDVHGNGRALRATLRDAERRGFERLVFMGDLLNYGVDTREVVETVAAAQARWGASVLRGNHDDVVLDLLEGRRTEYFAKLPAWIRESIELTMKDLDVAAFKSLRFDARLEQQPFFFAHANPWGESDYRYLNSAEDHDAAARSLAGLGARIGVFGHTHRVRVFAASDSGPRFVPVAPGAPLTLAASSTWVVNAGSIGQPREAPPVCRFLALTAGEHVTCEVVEVAWDRDDHVRAIAQAPLSRSTRDRLIAFFESGAPVSAP